MQPAVRERLGKAAFTEWRKEGERLPPWEEMPQEARDYFMRMGEAVAKSLAEMLVPSIMNAFFDEREIERLLSTAQGKSSE
jgi:hypothetical protein